MPEVKTLRRIGQDPVAMVTASNGNTNELRPLQRIEQGNVKMVGASSGIVIHTDGVPAGGHTGDLLAKRTEANYDVEWISPASAVEQDNTRPITSAAVYTEIGNINALLASI